MFLAFLLSFLAGSVTSITTKHKNNLIYHPDRSSSFTPVADYGSRFSHFLVFSFFFRCFETTAPINITFLDGTRFIGTDGCDVIDIGGFKGLTIDCSIINSPNLQSKPDSASYGK